MPSTRPLLPSTRILLLIAALLPAGAWFLPIWEIDLYAPQYPEGLNMKIWVDRLSGDVEIINGINHYIGMKAIREEMFPEFEYMKYLVGVFIILGLLPVLLKRRLWLTAFVVALILGGLAGLIDFWMWGRDYGSDLDPKAAISVPGMVYSPPIFGYKSLLNFVAYSGPDLGGAMLIACGVLASALLVRERMRNRAWLTGGKGRMAAVIAAVLPVGCSPKEPEPVSWGKESCAQCRMILSDPHYGCQMITPKGKIFKFDDVNCLVSFSKQENARRHGESRLYIVDFTKQDRFLPVDQALFFFHPKLRSPMGSRIGAFADRKSLDETTSEVGDGGEVLRWDEVRSRFAN